MSTSDQLDTDYLRGFLRSSVNARRSTSASGTYRLDGKGARVPRMGIDDQRRYGSAFRALSEFEEGIRKVHELSRRLADIAREGLTTGALTPENWSRAPAGPHATCARNGLAAPLHVTLSASRARVQATKRRQRSRSRSASCWRASASSGVISRANGTVPFADTQDGHGPELQALHRVHRREPYPFGVLRRLALDAEHRYPGGLQLVLRAVQGEVEARAHADLVRGQALIQQFPHPVHQGLGLLLPGGVTPGLGRPRGQARYPASESVPSPSSASTVTGARSRADQARISSVER
ncbi:hypothetical protein SALBM217S_08810 [Streptomyces griseoloalbus]